MLCNRGAWSLPDDDEEELGRPMKVKLILATGSHAGIEEWLKQGYYMIGRHKECQIRPKSRSVSRRHCLLKHSPKGVGAFDLGSTNGTRVNDRPLKPNQWVSLSDGDQLQCGKVLFKVSVDLSQQVPTSSVVAESSQSGQEPAPSIVQGEAWQEFDIVRFLQAEDEAERLELYGSVSERKNAVGSESNDHTRTTGEISSQSIAATSLNLLEGDEEAKAILEEARRNARGGDNAALQHEFRARRIAAIQAKIEAKRRNADREIEINNQLRRMLRRDA